MEVASGVIAVASVSIQLAESVKKIKSLLRDIKEAPDEWQRLASFLEQLWHMLTVVNALTEQQYGCTGLGGSSFLIIGALRNYERCGKKL